MAKLQILSGKRQGSVIDLPSSVDLDVGNRKSAKLTIRDPWISYNHAKISGQDGRFFIEDLGSSNGTWINGQKIKRHELAANVLIYFGKTKVKFTLGDGKVADEELGEKPGDAPWWDKVIDDGAGKKVGAAKVRRIENELREERRMREALEKFLQLPKDASVGDVARAGELERRIKELEAGGGQSNTGHLGPSQTTIDEAVEAERAKSEKQRREHMSTLVELEGKVAQAESRAVEAEGRVQDGADRIKKEVAKAKEKAQAEIDELQSSLEESRKSASSMASGGDEALQAQSERVTTLETSLDEARAKLKVAEGRVEILEDEAKNPATASGGEGGASSEVLETLKSQLWASIEEATKWKEQAAQLAEEVEPLRDEADKWKEDHAQIVQEIDDISMEQIEVEEELGARIEELEAILDDAGVDYPKMEGGEDDEGGDEVGDGE